jgi:hypothetical protein
MRTMANSDRCSDGTAGKVLRVLEQVEQAADPDARARAARLRAPEQGHFAAPL